MRKKLDISAFEYDSDQKRILDNAEHLYIDDAEMVEHFSYVQMRHQLTSTNYGLDAEKEFIKKKFEKYKKEATDFDKIDYNKSFIKIKGYTPDEINKEKLTELLCDPSAPPVVIKGLMNNTKATDVWTHEYLMENYGDVELFGMDYSRNDGADKNIGFGEGAKKVTAGFVLKNQLDPKSKEVFYINNSVDFFNQYPELLEDVEVSRLNNMVDELVQPLFPQLFIGNFKTWGTDWHVNNDVSATFGISGVKRWFFMDPLHAYGLQIIPTPHTPAGMLSSAFVGGSTSIRYDLDYHILHNPIYAYTPKYYFDQGPGDVIFFPKWWPHSIINQSPLTIMANQRYTEVNLAENKKSFDTALRMPLYENILRSDPRYRDYNFKIYQSLQNEEIITGATYFGRKEEEKELENAE
jgi:hypothetical protein